MYATIDPNRPLSEVVAAATNAEDLFEEEGIDYWFGWTQPFRTACEAAHVLPEEIAFRLLARDRSAKDPRQENLVSLLSDLDQQFDLRLEPALNQAHAAVAKLGPVGRARCGSTIDTIERVIRAHVDTARRTLSPVAAAIDVGADVRIDEKILRHLAMEHSILALRAKDLREEAARAGVEEFTAAASHLVREIHQHIKLSFNFILPRLLQASLCRPSGIEPW